MMGKIIKILNMFWKQSGKIEPRGNVANYRVSWEHLAISSEAVAAEWWRKSESSDTQQRWILIDGIQKKERRKRHRKHLWYEDEVVTGKWILVHRYFLVSSKTKKFTAGNFIKTEMTEWMDECDRKRSEQTSDNRRTMCLHISILHTQFLIVVVFIVFIFDKKIFLVCLKPGYYFHFHFHILYVFHMCVCELEWTTDFWI